MMPPYNIQKAIFYWTRVLLALGAAAYFLFIALTMLSAAYHEYNVGVEEYAKYERERERYKRKSADEVISKCPVAGGLIEPECLKKELNSFIEKDTSDKDLQAQQDMAKWAFFTLIVGVGGVIISVGGLIGLFMSLHQTRRSIKVAEMVGQAQVRAYLSIEFESEFRANQKGVYPFKIQNTGSSPAKKIRYVAAQFVLDHPLGGEQGDLISYDPSQRVPFRTLAHGQNFEAEAEFDGRMSREDWEIVKANGDRRIYLVVRVFYEDFFGVPHETKFCGYSEASPVVINGVNMTKIDWLGADILNDAT